MHGRFQTGWGKHTDFLLADLLAAELAAAVSCLLCFHALVLFTDPLYRLISMMIAVLHFCTAFFDETYHGILRRGYLKEAQSCLRHTGLLLSAMLLCLYLLKLGENMSRLFFVYLLLFCPLFIWSIRCVLKKQILKHLSLQSNLLVLVHSGNAQKVVTRLQESRTHLIGVCLYDDHRIGASIAGVPVVTSYEHLLDYIKAHVVDDLFVSLENGQQLPSSLMDTCVSMGVSVHLSLAWIDNADPGQMVEKIGKYTVLTRSVRLASVKQMFLKRLFDILVSAAGLLLTALATLIVGPMIYAASPGPIFFQQTRVGKNGRTFQLYKFRSMYLDAEARKQALMDQNKLADGRMFKLDHDPRIIPGVGQFIRRYSIDELPQFWNVLKGDMSLIGTRPPTVAEYETYDYHHKARLAIKPGITGLWQVSGRSKITDFEQVVKLDTEYITSWNLWLDLKILFKTVKVVLKGDGAS